MSACERLFYYGYDLPQEPRKQIEGEAVLDSSRAGQIRFDDVVISYPSNPDVVIIKNLDIEIAGGEKIGIVGRTGSGKSTLVFSLVRIMEPQSGKIWIDGTGADLTHDTDISKIALSKLRTDIFIVPQTPILFQGTIRSNIDYLDAFTDAEIWKVLELCGLKLFVSSLEKGLATDIESQGTNMSAGQQQQLYISIALLQKSKIIIFDESTAALDSDADGIIDLLIQEHFKHVTVLTIAHRLSSIASCDRVLVMDNGIGVEFDTPATLLANPSSYFSDLAISSGSEVYKEMQLLSLQKNK